MYLACFSSSHQLFLIVFNEKKKRKKRYCTKGLPRPMPSPFKTLLLIYQSRGVIEVLAAKATMHTPPGILVLLKTKVYVCFVHLNFAEIRNPLPPGFLHLVGVSERNPLFLEKKKSAQT